MAKKVDIKLTNKEFNVSRCAGWLLGKDWVTCDNHFDFKVYVDDKDIEVVERMLGLFVNGVKQGFLFYIDIDDGSLKFVDSFGDLLVARLDISVYADIYNFFVQYSEYFELKFFEIEFMEGCHIFEDDYGSGYVLKFGFNLVEGVKMSDLMDEVTCVGCGKKDTYPVGYLTEKARKRYRCSVCRQDIFELAVDEKEHEDVELLID